MYEYFWLIPGYIALYVFYALLKTILPDKLENLIFCKTCFSFASMLLVGIIFSFHPIILSLMGGMTISGIAYRFDDYLKKRGYNSTLQYFIIQLILTSLAIALLTIFYLK